MKEDNTNNEIFLGILGGMGPMAGVELQKRIIEMTPATKDQDHMQMICFTNPKINDRTTSLDMNIDFSKSIISSLNSLKKAGANLGVITCNTAHAKFDQINNHSNLDLINLVKETVDYIKLNFKTVDRVGVLATSGTINSGIYQSELEKNKISCVKLNSADQEELMKLIYGKKGIKAGFVDENNSDLLNSYCRILSKNGAQLIILACTELSLFEMKQNNIIDPLSVVSEKVIKLNKFCLFS